MPVSRTDRNHSLAVIWCKRGQIGKKKQSACKF